MPWLEATIGDVLALSAEESTGHMPAHTHAALALPRARDVKIWEPPLLSAYVVGCYSFGQFAIYSFN